MSECLPSPQFWLSAGCLGWLGEFCARFFLVEERLWQELFWASGDGINSPVIHPLSIEHSCLTAKQVWETTAFLEKAVGGTGEKTELVPEESSGPPPHVCSLDGFVKGKPHIPGG